MSWKKMCKITCRALSPNFSTTAHRSTCTHLLSLSRPSFKFPACTHTNLIWLLQSWSRDQELDKRQKNLQFGTYARRFFWKEPPTTKKKKTQKGSDLQQSNQNCWTRVPSLPWCRWKQDGSWRKLLMTCKIVRGPACRAALQQQLGYNIPYCCQLPV